MEKKSDKPDTQPKEKVEKTPEQIEAEKKQAAEKAEREEQERTTKAKAVFLDAYERSMSIITVACQKANISRETFYQWKRNDPAFAERVERINEMLIDYSEDKLKQAIVKGNLKAVLFHLGRRSPTYKQKIENVLKDERTLEDLIDEAAEEEERQNENVEHPDTTKKEDPDGQPHADASPIVHQEQAGGKGEVSSEHGSTVLPSQSDTPQPHPESEAKGSDSVH